MAKNGDRKIPLLESVFKAFPDIPINVDIKSNSDELIDKVSVHVRIIRESSFNMTRGGGMKILKLEA